MSTPDPSGITIQASKVHKRYRSPKQTDGPRKTHKTEIPTFVDPLIVTFKIGPNGSPDQKSFIIHKEVACFHSPVLNAALNGEFIEGQTQTYTLEDTTPGSFRLLMQWLYGGEFKVSQLSADLATMSRGERNQEYEHLLELWILADKLLIPRLQNLVLRVIQHVSDKTNRIFIAGLKYVWEHTGPESVFRAYWVAVVAHELGPGSFEDLADRFPADFLLRLAIFHAKNNEKERNGDEKAEFDIDNFLVWVDDKASR